MITYLVRNKPKYELQNCFAILINDKEFDDYYILNIIYNKKTLTIYTYNVALVDKNYKNTLLRNEYEVIDEYEFLFNSFYRGLINAVLIKSKNDPRHKFIKSILEKYKIGSER